MSPKTARLSLFLASFAFLPAAAHAASVCGKPVAANFESTALNFMKSQQLIHPGDENEYFKWGYAGHSVRTQQKCLVVMAVGLKNGNRLDFSNLETVEVIAYDAATKAFSKFEKAITIPQKIRAEIVACAGPGIEGTSTTCSATIPNAQFPAAYSPYRAAYYAEFTDPASVADVLKSHLTGVRVPGFSASVKQGQKASFDPSKKRHWSVVKSQFSLRRGMTTEVLDIQPADLDGLRDPQSNGPGDGGGIGPVGTLEQRSFVYSQDYFDTLWKTCPKAPQDPSNVCSVAPWGTAFFGKLIQ